MPEAEPTLATDPADLETTRTRLLTAAFDLADAARSDATKRAYASDWAHFTDFCDRLEFTPLPADPADVALYLVDLHQHGAAVATIERRLASIADAHHRAGSPSPGPDAQVRAVMTGIRRTSNKKRTPKRALTVAEFEAIAADDNGTLTDTRDTAIITVGFFGGLRRSELAALNVDDITRVDEGLRVEIRRSKTDQTGHGRTIALAHTGDAALCPVRNLQRWLTDAEIDDGPIFRRIRRGDHLTGDRISDQTINLIVKKRAERIGTNPNELGAHSLRSGLITAAAERGLEERAIARQTGHRSIPTLRSYIQTAGVFNDNAATQLGL
ncbi:MAG: site-specific integrase [Actinomycetota bacterium]